MSSTPWTVQSNKRKSPATSSTVRKRARFSDDVARRSSTPRSNSQKTLTQIAFVDPSPTNRTEDADLQEIPTSNRRRSRSSTFKPRRLKKQDSTLTQMPWLATSTHPDERIEYDLLSPTILDASDQPHISQNDGTDDIQPHSRNVHILEDNHATTLTPPVHSEQTSRRSESTRRKEGGSGASGRRRSGRIASKVLPGEPDESRKASKPSHYTTVDRHPRTTTYHPAPLLEIQDSTEFDECPIELPSFDRPRQYDRPQTPSRDYIASSQTPETAIRHTAYKRQNRDTSPSKSMRTPLQERSANIPPITRSSIRKNGRSTKTLDPPPKSRSSLSPPRKICVLKVPGRALLPRMRHADDSQRDIYSLQATSSPQREKRLQKASSTGQSASAVAATEAVSDLPHNEEIRSSPPELDTQASLPQLEDLIPRRSFVEANAKLRRDIGLKTIKSHHQAAAGDAIDTQDFYKDRPGCVNTATDEMLLDVETGPEVKDVDEANTKDPSAEVDESEVEFGSPILNDTQFNSEIKHRTSSPTSISGANVSQEQKRLSDTVEISTPTQQRRTQVTFTDVPEEYPDTDAETSLPTPRLVKRMSSVATQLLSRDNDNKEEADEPELPRPVAHSSTYLKTSLNDISSSSMPLTVPTQLVTTQKSIHPASMPRPSQMSTQDPTQSYFFSSIAPVLNHSHAAERILIKDSSSSDGHLHEIPIHIGQSQTQDRPMKLVIEDSEEELDDLDLDPATGSKYSARKPISRQVTKNSSSLKSIHISTSSSSGKGQNSSSPVRQLRTESLLASKRKRISLEDNNGVREEIEEEILDVLADIPTSSPTPPPPKKQRLPIPGFDNDTQSDFTQNGHVTAAYIHKQRELGRYPEWFVPKTTSLGGHTKRKSTK